MRRGLASLALAAAIMLSAAPPVGAITYGHPDTAADYPNVGAMLVAVESAIEQWCSGTLIEEWIFLTAAHCITALPESAVSDGDVFISFSGNLGSGPVLIGVDAVDIHPSFNRTRANPFDIGVLLFDEATGEAPADIAPVGYLDDLGRSIRSERFTAVGYGAARVSRRTGWQGILDNTARRYADQGFLSRQRAWLTLNMNQSTGSGGTCYGDSGGPHLHDDGGGGMVVVSITIIGDAVCKATDQTYRLDRSWVHDYLASLP